MTPDRRFIIVHFCSLLILFFSLVSPSVDEFSHFSVALNRTSETQTLPFQDISSLCRHCPHDRSRAHLHSWALFQAWRRDTLDSNIFFLWSFVTRARSALLSAPAFVPFIEISRSIPRHLWSETQSQVSAWLCLLILVQNLDWTWLCSRAKAVTNVGCISCRSLSSSSADDFLSLSFSFSLSGQSIVL